MDKSKILIVEDEALIAESLRLDLENMGYSIFQVVDSGEEAVNQARKFKPDLILMDISLRGEMDGKTAAEKIYQDVDPSIPIIFLTGYAGVDWIEHARRGRKYKLLVKPINEKALRDYVRSSLE
jgi:CheY-like chemotaxis protein